MEMPTNFIESIYWFLDYGFDLIGVFVIFGLLVYSIKRSISYFRDE